MSANAVRNTPRPSSSRPTGNKLRSAESSSEPSIVGEPVSPDDALLPHLATLSERTGWHERSGYGVHVAKKARSFRIPFFLRPQIFLTGQHLPD